MLNLDKRYIVALAAIMLFMIPLGAQATDVKQHFEITVPSHNICGLDATQGRLGERVYGSFEVISGTDITLLILDAANYIEFFNERAFTPAYIIDNVVSSPFEFEYPSDGGGTWHILFNNRDSSIEQLVVGDWYQGLISTTTTTTTTIDITTTSTSSTSTTSTTTNQVSSIDTSLLIVAGVVLAIILVAGVSYSKRGHTKTQTQPDTQAKVLVICPYCGAKTEQGLTECSRCGAKI